MYHACTQETEWKGFIDTGDGDLYHHLGIEIEEKNESSENSASIE